MAILKHKMNCCRAVVRAVAFCLLSLLLGCNPSSGRDDGSDYHVFHEGERHLVRVCEWTRSATPADISGIAWQGEDSYWAVCDSRSELCRLRIQVDADTGLLKGCACVELRRVPGGEDMEGLAFDPLRGSLWISDERGPRIFEYHPGTGRIGGEIELPGELRRPAKNRALEAVEILPDGLTLWTCNENELPCDVGRLEGGREMVRLIRFSRTSGDVPWRMTGQWAYSPEPPGASGKGVRNGVAALCALPDGELLVLERQKDTRDGLTFRARIFAVDIPQTTDVTTSKTDMSNHPTLLAKNILFDASTGKSMYEGMSLGPKLRDGSTILVLVSDGDGEAEESVMTLRLVEAKPEIK